MLICTQRQTLSPPEQAEQLPVHSFHNEKFFRRVGTYDGQSLAPPITVLARAMLQSKKKDVALDLFTLELSPQGVRY